MLWTLILVSVMSGYSDWSILPVHLWSMFGKRFGYTFRCFEDSLFDFFLSLRYLRGFQENPRGHYDMKFKGPQLKLTGPYSMHGQILVLPVRGSGISNFTLSNPELHVRFTGKTKEKNGKIHLYTDDLRMTFKITKWVLIAHVRAAKLLTASSYRLCLWLLFFSFF